MGRPYYVRTIEPESRTVHIGPDIDLYTDTAGIEEVNWVSIPPPEEPLRAKIKIRYLHPGANATIKPTGDRSVIIQFDEPQRALTPGQSAVFYHGERVLGGGLVQTQASV